MKVKITIITTLTFLAVMILEGCTKEPLLVLALSNYNGIYGGAHLVRTGTPIEIATQPYINNFAVYKIDTPYYNKAVLRYTGCYLSGGNDGNEIFGFTVISPRANDTSRVIITVTALATALTPAKRDTLWVGTFQVN